MLSSEARGSREWADVGTGFAQELHTQEMEPMPLDFAEYLSNRLGLTESATSELLGAWLRTYEPESARREREVREAQRPSRLPHGAVEVPMLARSA